MPEATFIYPFPRYYPSNLEKFRQCYDRQPYTYYIGWFDLNIWYYGSRTSKHCGLIPENDLWNNYFTSSKKKVAEYRELYGEPDIVMIHRTFNTIFETHNFEDKQLNFIKENGFWDYFLNQNIAGAIDPKVISISNKKENLSQETIDKRSISLSGKNNPIPKGSKRPEMQGNYHHFFGKKRPEISKRMSNENNPSKREDVKHKMRKPRTRISCPHCGLEGGSNNMKRWHFDKCKWKT